MKYLWRFDYKDKPIEDLQKAKWYLDKLIEEVNGRWQELNCSLPLDIDEEEYPGDTLLMGQVGRRIGRWHT